jgi:hypothetical protein
MAITNISYSHNINAAVRMYLPGLLLNILLTYHPTEAIVLITVPSKIHKFASLYPFEMQTKDCLLLHRKKDISYVQTGDLFVTVHNIFTIHESYDTASRYITIHKAFVTIIHKLI